MTTTQEEATSGAITKMLEEKLWKYNITYDDIFKQARTLELSLIEKAKEEERHRIVGILNTMIDENRVNMKILYDTEELLEKQLDEAIERITNQS